jgi:hypothetical protein
MRHYNYLRTQIRTATVSTFAHTSLRSVTIAALCTSLALSSACTKKDDASSGAATSKSATSYEDPVLAVPLLKKIPATAAGVAVIDLKGDAYKKFLSSPFADAYNSFNVVKTVLDEADKQGASEDGELAGAKVMLEALKKLGAISAEGKPQLEKVFGQSVVFVDTPPAGKEDSTNVGVLASAADGANMKEKLAVVEGLLKESGVPTAKETYQGGEGFAVPLSGVSGASSESKSAEGATSDGSAAPAP